MLPTGVDTGKSSLFREGKTPSLAAETVSKELYNGMVNPGVSKGACYLNMVQFACANPVRPDAIKGKFANAVVAGPGKLF